MNVGSHLRTAAKMSNDWGPSKWETPNLPIWQDFATTPTGWLASYIRQDLIFNPAPSAVRLHERPDDGLVSIGVCGGRGQSQSFASNLFGLLLAFIGFS